MDAAAAAPHFKQCAVCPNDAARADGTIRTDKSGRKGGRDNNKTKEPVQ